MAMFVCIDRDKWVVPARCDTCTKGCGLDHPQTVELGSALFGGDFATRQLSTTEAIASRAQAETPVSVGPSPAVSS